MFIKNSKSQTTRPGPPLSLWRLAAPAWTGGWPMAGAWGDADVGINIERSKLKGPTMENAGIHWFYPQK